MPTKELCKITNNNGRPTQVTPGTLAERLGKTMRPRTALDSLDILPPWMRRLRITKSKMR